MLKQVIRILSLMVAIGVAPAALADPDCPKLSGWFSVKITAKDNHLSLNKDLPVCAALDKPIKIRIDNPGSSDFKVGAGDVTVVQKAGSAVIISGSNTNNVKYLEITVKEPAAGFNPGNLGACGDGTDDCAGFDIMVDGLGKLDPKVRVVDNNFALFLTHETLVEVFEDLDVSLDEVNELFRLFATDME